MSQNFTGNKKNSEIKVKILTQKRQRKIFRVIFIIPDDLSEHETLF